MPMPSENDGAVRGSEGTPGPTNSLTRHMSTAAVIGVAESTAGIFLPSAWTEMVAYGLLLLTLLFLPQGLFVRRRA